MKQQEQTTVTQIHQAMVGLLPYQRRWIDLPGQLKVCEKAHAIGITWAEAFDNVSVAGKRSHQGGKSVGYIGQSAEMIQSYIQYCASLAGALGYVVDDIEKGAQKWGDIRIDTMTLGFQSGHQIVALSVPPGELTADRLLPHFGVVVIDEMAYRGNSGAVKVFDPSALLSAGCDIHLISTHHGERSVFNNVVCSLARSPFSGSLLRITFRAAVAQGLYRHICSRLGVAWSCQREEAWVKEVYAMHGSNAAEVLDCIPSGGGGEKGCE